MRGRLFSGALTVVLIAMALIGGGCKSPSPTFYALTPVQDQYVSLKSSPTRNAVIGIGPVKIASYLDESLIVTRTSANEMAKAQFHRWVGSFKNNFINVLADDIGYLLPTQRIHFYPWRLSIPIDYRIIMDVVRCDGRLGDAAYLEVRWTVLKGPEKKIVKMARSTLQVPVIGPGYAALVAAESRAVAQLSQEIVAAIQGGTQN
jgi:uncharacterized lipoprotein YmbA